LEKGSAGKFANDRSNPNDTEIDSPSGAAQPDKPLTSVLQALLRGIGASLYSPPDPLTRKQGMAGREK